MSPNANAAYARLRDLPPLVAQAVDLARRTGFENSCRPEYGRLLMALAGGAEVIGETGTGCGVGLAWLASGARPGTRLVSVESDPDRATLATALFADQPRVTVVNGDWLEITRHGPFDLLFLDGGASGKQDGRRADPDQLLRPGGTLIVDDLTPATQWPPRHQGAVDHSRLHWLTLPGYDATELRLAPQVAALVATRRHPALDPELEDEADGRVAAEHAG
jgi:predicted O-methyltransferase YrrM